MTHIKRQHRRQQDRGFTLIEMILASIIGLMTALVVGFIFLFTVKVHAILLPQMGYQQESARSMQVMGDLLRNSIYQSINIPSSNTIRYESSELPEDQVAKIVFDRGRLIYFADETDTRYTRVLAKKLHNVSFFFDGQMIEVRVVFKYRKYRGHNQSEAERLNGTFETRIYPRNWEI